MATFTLPYQLRALARQHQKKLYSLMFTCVTSTLRDFGVNPQHLGATLGMTAVLHTHTRRLDYHPHIHVVVPGGGIDKKRRQWKKLKGEYLFNEFALAKVFRARFIAALKENGFSFCGLNELFELSPQSVFCPASSLVPLIKDLKVGEGSISVLDCRWVDGPTAA